ncbi:MAG: formylglycine-generating enzyme family protein, partial [Myxococcota bacterium]|nr:formylglycine-generating enzyme family protein [Myxococcota bacterium]
MSPRRESLTEAFVALAAQERDLFFKLDLLVETLNRSHPLCPWEIWALDVAAQEGIQLDYERPGSGGLPGDVADDLRRLLCQRFGMKGGLARWVVDTFGAALDMKVHWPETGERPDPPPALDPVAGPSALETRILEDAPSSMVELGSREGSMGDDRTPLESDHPLRRLMQVTQTPPQEVQLNRPYAIGAVTVTQAQWRAVMGEDPPGLTFPGDHRPVHGVNWFEAAAFCNALSEREGLRPAYVLSETSVSWPDPEAPGYRLPTDAEWEISCRAGATTPFHTGPLLTPSQANFDAQFGAGGTLLGAPVTVGSNAPNDWGLYDTHGTVCVWTWSDATPPAGGVDPTPRGD